MLAAALAPKCPLCVAAALSAIGLGGAGALHLAPFLRPLGIALAVVIGASLVWAERRRAHCKCRVMGHGVEKRAKV
jgi:hypothetical protein